jgi:uncharacterized membrane protein
MDIGYMSFCAISKALNCDTVSQSQYSTVLNVPLAIWGAVGYAFFLLLLFYARKQKPWGQRVWPLLLIIAGFYSFISIILALISSIYIESYCLMCILVFGVNFLLLFFVWIVRKRFDPSRFTNSLQAEARFWKENRLKGSLFGFAFIIISLLLIGYYPKYWHHSTVMTADFSTGISAEGHPWIGAKEPKYTITEFTDYQCFQCKKMHSYLRLIVAQHPHQVRLVHRHFPMDHTVNPIVKQPYHIGSGKMALVAIYSATKGKFWDMNDMLFKMAIEKDAINTKTIAKMIGLDLSDITDPETKRRIVEILQDDIKAGIDLGLVGTPGFEINGEVYSGQIPPEVIRTITTGK